MSNSQTASDCTHPFCKHLGARINSGLNSLIGPPDLTTQFSKDFKLTIKEIKKFGSIRPQIKKKMLLHLDFGYLNKELLKILV